MNNTMPLAMGQAPKPTVGAAEHVACLHPGETAAHRVGTVGDTTWYRTVRRSADGLQYSVWYWWHRISYS